METNNETYYCTWMILFINESYCVMLPVFLYLPPSHYPISFPKLPWDFGTMNNLRSLLKSTVFLPICYVAVMRGNEMTLWKYNIKIHKIVGKLFGLSFPAWLVLFCMGSYRWLTVSWNLNPKYCFFFSFFMYCFFCFVLFLQMNISHPV